MAVTKVLSIEVTDIVTRVVEVDYGKKDPVVHKAVIFATPDKTVSDGVIEGVETFTKEFQRQTHGFGTKNVVLALATNKVISREVSIPEMRDDQISDFIENQKSEYFPMDTSGHNLVHRVLDRDKEKKQIRVIVYAVPQKLIANYQSFASLAGLRIVSIDYNGNAIYQWLSNESHKEMDMFLQINERSTLFTVLEKRKYAIQRNINFGAYVLCDRLIQSGYYESEEMGQNLTRPEALKKLTEEELMFPSFAAIRLSEPNSEAEERLHSAKEQVTEGMRQLLGNLSRVMEYYHSKNQNAELNTIYIGGCGARIKGLKSFLENEFSGVEIITLEQLPDVKISSSVSKAGINTSELIACLGAAEGSLTFITVSKESKANKLIFLGALILVAGLAGAAVFFFLGKGQYNKKVNEKERIESMIAELEASGIEELETQYHAAELSRLDVLEVNANTYRANEEWNAVLKQIEEKTVKNLVVSNLSSDANNLVMNLAVTSKEEAAKLLLQLQQIPYFDKINISSIKEGVSEATGQTIVSFTVSCHYTRYYEATEDKNGDGVIDVCDSSKDRNGDDQVDIRDVIIENKEKKQIIRNLIEHDVNNDGVVDEGDDYNQNGVFGDEEDRSLFARLENLNLEVTVGDLNEDGVIDMLDGVIYLQTLDAIEAAEKEGMEQ